MSLAVYGPFDMLDGRATWAAVDDVTLFIVPVEKLSEDAWRQLLMDAQALGSRRNMHGNSSLSYYAFPVTATHRKIAAEVAATTPSARHAIMTDSALFRAALTAMAWLVPSIQVRAFALHDVRTAAKWIAEGKESLDVDELVRQAGLAYERHGVMPRSHVR